MAYDTWAQILRYDSLRINHLNGNRRSDVGVGGIALADYSPSADPVQSLH
jgi:hypothetical protein